MKTPYSSSIVVSRYVEMTRAEKREEQANINQLTEEFLDCGGEVQELKSNFVKGFRSKSVFPWIDNHLETIND